MLPPARPQQTIWMFFGLEHFSQFKSRLQIWIRLHHLMCRHQKGRRHFRNFEIIYWLLVLYIRLYNSPLQEPVITLNIKDIDVKYLNIKGDKSAQNIGQAKVFWLLHWNMLENTRTRAIIYSITLIINSSQLGEYLTSGNICYLPS